MTIPHAKELVKLTPTFLSLDKLQKSLILNKANFEKIRHGINVSNNKGLLYWKNNFLPTTRVYNIVKEFRWQHWPLFPEINQTCLVMYKWPNVVNGRSREVYYENPGIYCGDYWVITPPDGGNITLKNNQIINWQTL